MKYSIIVPVYKVEKYLPQCVDSVLRQTFADFELILINDGSPDNCAEICEKYAGVDNRVRFISQPNGGLSAARNTGIQASKGDYLIFLDSDDYWVGKNDLELIDRAAAQYSADAVFWMYKKTAESFNEFSDGVPDDFSVDFTDSRAGLIRFIRGVRLVSCAWDVAVSRSLFEDGGLDFEAGVYSEDVEWIARLIMKAKGFAFTNLVMNAYRLRDDSITKTISEKNLADLNSHYRKIAEYIETSDEDTKAALKAYLGEQCANYILALTLSEPETAKKYTDCEYLSYIRFCKSKRARAIKTAVRVFGAAGTVSLIKKIKRL